MYVSFTILTIIFILMELCCYAQIHPFRRPLRSAMKLKRRLQEKIEQYRQKHTETICYDVVGCFELPHRRSPLQKIPEDPDSLDTKFYLFRRNINFSKPEVLYYGDNGTSLRNSTFSPTQPLKMIIHGYMGRWNRVGLLLGVSAYLKIYDCNVVLMDWQIGARGPQYANAAANTEVAGRQLGLLLAQMVEMGLNPDLIHLIGFSLGAHVAGSASELLKNKGHLIGRITGLDAASPLFRTEHFREKYKKLDRSDAKFVDVVHTDSSPFVTDGFGLWQPVGHVDFFPNGGQEQPGCIDTKQSVVVTHFDKSLSDEIACSHLRAWRLFQQTLLDKAMDGQCELTAFSCPGGLPSFEKGHCFPQFNRVGDPLALDSDYRNEIGRLGENVKGEGVMYLVTRSTPPYCGTQLQASVQISQKTEPVKGVLHLRFMYSNYTVEFQIRCKITDYVMTGTIMGGYGAAEYNTLTENIKELQGTLTFSINDNGDSKEKIVTPPIFLDKIRVRDMYGTSWHFCQKDTTINHTTGLKYETIEINLNRNIC